MLRWFKRFPIKAWCGLYEQKPVFSLFFFQVGFVMIYLWFKYDLLCYDLFLKLCYPNIGSWCIKYNTFRRVGVKNGIGIFVVFTKFLINIKWFTNTIHFLDNISINNKIAYSVWNVFFSGLFEVKRFDNFTIYWTDVSYISKTCPAKLSKTNYLRHDQFSFRAFGNLSHFQE